MSYHPKPMDSKSNKLLSDAFHEYEQGQETKAPPDDTEAISQWRQHEQRELLSKQIEALFDAARRSSIEDASATLSQIPALVDALRQLPEDEVRPPCDEILFDMHLLRAEHLAKEQPLEASEALRQALSLRHLPSVVWRRITLLRELNQEEEAQRLRMALLESTAQSSEGSKERDHSQALARFFQKPPSGAPVQAHLGLFTSPHDMLAWSYGEVNTSALYEEDEETPSFHGLLCPRIFGPLQDYECICGKYRGMRHRGIVCERCGVELVTASSRGLRVGHINLASPVVHPWASVRRNNLLSVLLDISPRDISRIIKGERYIVLYEQRYLSCGALLEPARAMLLMDEYGSDAIGTGVEALRRLLAPIDLYQLRESLESKQNVTINQSKLDSLQHRRELIERLLDLTHDLRPENLILQVIPVFAPEREVVSLGLREQDRAALQAAYINLISTNETLKNLQELNAPDEDIAYWIRALQQETNNLFGLFGSSQEEK